MARKSSLHNLRLLIAGPFRTRFTFHAHHRVQHYTWGCGCSATGIDDDDLDVRHCDVHYMTLGDLRATGF